mmetsp:Transcript_5757/g.7560  ORF Transcript_5757/g.7560 Transcript_5757/m.7560 type:complete len:496 (-) Transcript_5757:297-1784(-)|eukprot:CAMPEP_0198144576 /NCGR_PEP_ID=MMETSP1443-20131203/16628_1 /TAXON_ID=186043 /ORGANISM="Entomoneis sp., Strain CCMP2396" /LENGTH=495 /DNA_ID=CAMNT_0043807987 /DNA_START=64 /DNA_END=1551 /DNA_ORIENTATION=+
MTSNGEQFPDEGPGDGVGEEQAADQEMTDGGTTTEGEKKSLASDLWSLVKPYKREIMLNQIMENEPGDDRRGAIINSLRDMGVKVFIIEARSIETTADILHHVHRVVDYVSRENQLFNAGYVDDEGNPRDPLGFQRCLLYQDRSGRLFNLMLASYSVGPASQYETLMTSFSGLEAMALVTILCRTFACAAKASTASALAPARLALIIGLVFSEEISLSWLNAQMLVRSVPSVSAHTLTSHLGSDVLRKASLFVLATASSAEDDTTRGWVTIAGVAMICILALANLGSRAWHFMGWRPLQYSGPLKSVVAFFAAVAAGCVFPYMGHRKIHVGGRPAMEHVISTAVLVGVIFALSDIDEVQRYLITSSENCDQDYVNIAVGAWWTFTFMTSLIYAMSLPYKPPITPTEPDEDEPLLEHDHASPVGYRVPNIPNFEVDPSLASEGYFSLCSIQAQALIGLILAVVLGGGIIYLGFTDEDDELLGNGDGITRQLLGQFL